MNCIIKKGLLINSVAILSTTQSDLVSAKFSKKVFLGFVYFDFMTFMSNIAGKSQLPLLMGMV